MVVGLFERLTKWRLTARAYVGLFIVTFLLVAFFYAWRDEHKVVREAINTATQKERDINEIKQELKETKRLLQVEKEQNTPKLVGTIEQVLFTSRPGLPLTEIFVLMSIRNTGTPSIVEGYSIHLQAGDINVSTITHTIPKELVMTGPNHIITFHGDDALYHKTVKPIERGGLLRGWLRYKINGYESSRIDKIGTKLTINLLDVNRTLYPVEYVVNSPPTSLPTETYPGAEQPVRPRGKRPSPQ